MSQKIEFPKISTLQELYEKFKTIITKFDEKLTTILTVRLLREEEATNYREIVISYGLSKPQKYLNLFACRNKVFVRSFEINDELEDIEIELPNYLNVLTIGFKDDVTSIKLNNGFIKEATFFKTLSFTTIITLEIKEWKKREDIKYELILKFE